MHGVVVAVHTAQRAVTKRARRYEMRRSWTFANTFSVASVVFFGEIWRTHRSGLSLRTRIPSTERRCDVMPLDWYQESGASRRAERHNDLVEWQCSSMKWVKALFRSKIGPLTWGIERALGKRGAQGSYAMLLNISNHFGDDYDPRHAEIVDKSFAGCMRTFDGYIPHCCKHSCTALLT